MTTIVNHEASVSQTVVGTATVADPAVIGASVAINATEGLAFSNQAVATFTDPGGAEPNAFEPTGLHYVATIDWGDSTPLVGGAITLSGGTSP